MQIFIPAVEFYFDAITALVEQLSVEGLVNITDEVDEEHKGFFLLVGVEVFVVYSTGLVNILGHERIGYRGGSRTKFVIAETMHPGPSWQSRL